jgi:hypothetical protein
MFSVQFVWEYVVFLYLQFVLYTVVVSAKFREVFLGVGRLTNH